MTLGRLSFYRRYATRSLRRGGQRTVLAMFCIAVGVMATVALRLAGNMIAVSITGNVRAANGGDVAVQSTALPLAAADLRTFDTLRTQGLVTDYLPLGVQVGSARLATGHTLRLFTYILDQPARFPLVGSASFDHPGGATFATALAPADSIVVSRFIADQLGVGVGQRLRFTLAGGGARMLAVGGILANRVGAGGPTTAYISGATYAALDSAPERYGVVDVLTTADAASATVAGILRGDFPAASVQTVHEALATNQQFSDNINQFLDIVGLLALLIGGIGIVNTIQVLLSRRRVEIAVLKTTGYRRRDLYVLFGSETAALGLVGGVAGTAAGVGVSVLVKVLVERVLTIDLTFTLDAGICVEGVLIGVVTSLIFGLLPIARAAEVRPAAVLRDAATTMASPTSRAVSAALYALVSVLFTGMAAILLGDVGLAVGVVVGALLLIGMLTAAFYGVVVTVGRLPVPERFSPGYVALVSAAVLVSALVAIPLRGVGVALLALTSCGFVVVALPRRARNIVKLGLRAVGRARARTSTTMVALFIGVFAIGLIAVVGEDVSSTISASLSSLADYSVFVIASPADAAQATAATSGLAGVQARRVTQDLTAQPDAINTIPVAQYVAARGGARAPTAGDSGEFRLSSLSGVEGYDLTGGSLPDTEAKSGRALTRADAGTGNVLVPYRLAQSALSLHLGDTVTLTNPTAHTSVTVHIVGFYEQASRSSAGLKLKFFFQPVLGDVALVHQLGVAQASTIVALQVDESQRTSVLAALYGRAPDTTILDLTDLAAIVQQILGNVIDLLIAIASLALFAGIVIIANAVALAMLERRRELGILKATGHTSASVLAQVLLENAVVGALAAIAGMLMVTLATVPLGRVVLKTDLAVSTPTVLLIIVGIMALTTCVAAVVAWRPTRIRPLEVLRYE